MMNDDVNWDARFLGMVEREIKQWSKDPSTKVGAAIYRGKHLLVPSYNGFPMRIADTPERLNNRELKYKLVQHAEANAISACAKHGIATDGSTMVCTMFPCSVCAGLIINAGIVKVVAPPTSQELIERWGESLKLSNEMFEEAGVEVSIIDIYS